MVRRDDRVPRRGEVRVGDRCGCGAPPGRAGQGQGDARPLHAVLDDAFTLFPDGPKPCRRGEGGWSEAQRQAWNLATRMRTQSDQILRTLENTAVPLDNNT